MFCEVDLFVFCIFSNVLALIILGVINILPALVLVLIIFASINFLVRLCLVMKSSAGKISHFRSVDLVLDQKFCKDFPSVFLEHFHFPVILTVSSVKLGHGQNLKKAELKKRETNVMI